MSSSKIVVCSFYTADDYYRQHGERLAKNLSALGVEVVLREIQKKDGEDWADICRKKVPFIAEVCQMHPDKKVFLGAAGQDGEIAEPEACEARAAAKIRCASRASATVAVPNRPPRTPARSAR